MLQHCWCPVKALHFSSCHGTNGESVNSCLHLFTFGLLKLVFLQKVQSARVQTHTSLSSSRNHPGFLWLLTYSLKLYSPVLKPCKSQYLAYLIHSIAPARLLRSYGSNLLIFSKFILSSVSGRAFGGTLSVKCHRSLHPNPSCLLRVIDIFMSSASFCCIYYLPSFIFVCYYVFYRFQSALCSEICERCYRNTI